MPDSLSSTVKISVINYNRSSNCSDSFAGIRGVVDEYMCSYMDIYVLETSLEVGSHRAPSYRISEDASRNKKRKDEDI